jgi:hypothetical protein
VTNNIKEDAEVLRQALVLGMVPSRRAVAWADRLIADSELGQISASIYDVAFGETRPVGEMVEQLGALRGTADPTMVSRRLLGVLDEWYREHPEGGARVAQGVMMLARGGFLPEEEFGHEPLLLTEYFDEPHLFEPDTGDSELKDFLRQHSRAPEI